MKYKDKVTGCIEECDAIATVTYVTKETKDGKKKQLTCILQDWPSVKKFTEEVEDYYSKEPLVEFEPWRKALVAWCDIRSPITVKKEVTPDRYHPESEIYATHKLIFIFNEGDEYQQEISFILSSREIDDRPFDEYGNDGEQYRTWEALEEGTQYDMEELIGVEYDAEYDKAHKSEFKESHLVQSRDKKAFDKYSKEWLINE